MESAFGSANNSAFVLAHSGVPIAARNILRERIIRKGSGGPYELANYGLALGLPGQTGAEEYFRASEVWAKSNHVKAIIRFNRAAIPASQDNWVETERYLREALNLDRKDIKRYSDLSQYIKDARDRNQSIAKLLND
jgi:hypothetical protein